MYKIDANLSEKILSSLGRGRLFFLIAGILFLISGFLYLAVFQLLQVTKAKIIMDLLPGYWPTANFFKREFLAFVIIQALLVFIGTFFYIFRNTLTRFNKFYISQYLFLILFILAFISSVFLRDGLLRLFPFIAAIIFSVALLNHEALKNYIRKYRERLIDKSIYYKSYIREKINWQKITLIVSFLLLVAVLIPGYRAWYPLVLPNDYYEINNVFINTLANENTKTISFDNVQKFLEAERSELVHPKGYGELLSAFDGLNGWTAETGRVLYHHSYVFVPAIHYLKYGLDSHMPYLYGYGNTIFTALLMSMTGHNISAYFSTYPIGIFLGLLCVCALVGYCSQSKKIFFLACFLGLYEMYSVGFTAALLAASFSPMRYLGLGIQLAGVFYYFRSTGKFRLLILFLSSLSSLFWNGEFGYIGLVSPILAMLIDKKNQNLYIRAAFISSLLILAISYKLLSTPSTNIINAIYLGFFQINMPFLNGKQGVIFILIALMSELLLFMMCFKFEGGQRLARICILPTLFLITVKIIYNPSASHLAVTLIFLLPFLLLYIPYKSEQIAKNKLLVLSIFFLCIMGLSSYCWFAGMKYEEESNFIRKYHIQPFELSTWNSLGETMPFVTREDDISSRVMAIRNALKMNESLLILSPFDHLISFYVNPKNYCGHFELISNVAQRGDIDKISSCVSNSKEVLVVYDQALTMPCPKLQKLSLINRCPQKLEVKNNVASIVESLPNLKEVSRSGSLIFYRKKSDSDK